MKQGERTFQFKKNYLKNREEGKTIREIADFYGLSHRYAYILIQKLADELKVPYESLLDRPHNPHVVIGSGKVVKPVKRVDFSGFEKASREGLSSIDKTLNEMDKVLKDWPSTPEISGGCK